MDVSTAAPKRDRHVVPALVLGTVIAGLVVAAALFGHADAPVQVLQDASSGPLHAHYQVVNGARLAVCDDTTAVARDDDRRGVGGEIALQGPADVSVTVVGAGRTRRALQQATDADNRVSWDLPMTAPADKITIVARVNGVPSSCQILPTSVASSRLNPLSGLVG